MQERVDEWKNRKLKEWKDGRMGGMQDIENEDLNRGMAKWKNGGIEEWRNGRGLFGKMEE